VTDKFVKINLAGSIPRKANFTKTAPRSVVLKKRCGNGVTTSSTKGDCTK